MNISLQEWRGTKNELAKLLIILQLMAERTNSVIELEVGGRKCKIKYDEPLKEYIDYIFS